MRKQNRANSSTILMAMDLHSRTTAFPSHFDTKRKSTNLGVHHSSIIKIRTLIQELRPLLMETKNGDTSFLNGVSTSQFRISVLFKNWESMEKESVSEKSGNKDIFGIGSSLLEAKHQTPECPDQLAGNGLMPLRAVKCGWISFWLQLRHIRAYYGVAKKAFRKKMKKLR
ncbi:hypothetical protein L6164_008361 [Bauhinia variegata]|uniref:Uncharacterized protein n=1 Tax=Bauhinia variegata TaxID=167791 RepID=A0ACB9PGI7_BAUVA|nr:hypothetical protein L6164_008361 [Bauhinia variegata]